ncbi:hypothetical protein AB0L82_38190 [Nocardia sp. NPDC052001]|uniref:hypothetical protein n=1 Tax=Nocardia sp. NPDC052001 TaxID=3154853 RepID=UPI0034283344
MAGAESRSMLTASGAKFANAMDTGSLTTSTPGATVIDSRPPNKTVFTESGWTAAPIACLATVTRVNLTGSLPNRLVR